MGKTSEILNELQFISPFLAGIEKVNLFQAPEHYFDELPEKILTNIFLHSDEKNKEQPVPPGYFDDLSNRILLKIRNAEVETAKEEIRIISPLLSSLKGKKVFTVPKGYFENLGNSIQNKLKPEEAKIFPLHSAKKWWKYAAAAAVAAGITVGGLQIFNNNSNQNSESSSLTASANIPNYIKLSFQYKTPEQLNKGIESLSDDEIVAYLEKHGNLMDDEILTKDLNSDELPNAVDYLINDSTLNNFLNGVNLQDSDQNIQ